MCIIRDNHASASSAETDEHEFFPRRRRRHRSRGTIAALENSTAGVPCERVLSAASIREVDRLARGVRPAVGLACGSQRIACCRGAMSPHVSAVSGREAIGELTIIHPIGIADGRRGEREQHTRHEARYDHHATPRQALRQPREC